MPLDQTSNPSIVPTTVEREMDGNYFDYAMAVIEERALPDARDGLKPVHRRILYGMKVGGYSSGKPFKKSARIVGDVMGKYHPHGDSAIYDAMVRMVQPFAMRAPLIDGQGNYGSIDGDPPAAMRYTEARLSPLGNEGMVSDIDEGTVDFRPNYDGEEEEPTVLPARFPHLLVNGQEGIAVGVATLIPTHNLGEVIDATLAVARDPEIGLDDLMRLLPGPDFPTGGIIQGRGAIRQAYETGRGSLSISGVAEIVEGKRSGRTSIVITELPYAVNKERLVERISELLSTKLPTGGFLIEGVAALRDESDKNIRVVLDLKKDADAELVLNKLRKHTDFVKSFGYNAVCLLPSKQPATLGLKRILEEFVLFRREVIARRTAFRLNKVRDEVIKQVALYAARNAIDEVVSRIKASADSVQARASLMAMRFKAEGEFLELLREMDPDAPLSDIYHLNEYQARAILEMRLSSLTSLELDDIAAEARRLLKQVSDLQSILNDQDVLDDVMRTEMVQLREKWATPRLTRIDAAGPSDLTDDDMVEDKDVVITMTRGGYVKSTPLDAFREQARGGKGRSGMDTKDDDVVVRTIICTARTPLLFFTTRGIVHALKAYRIQESAPSSRGRAIVNYISGLREGEGIAAICPLPRDPAAAEALSMVFVTASGDVRRNAVSDFSSINRNGKIAMRLENENGEIVDRLVDVLLCRDDQDVVIATRDGRAVRFPATDIRIFKSRDSTGNKGIQLGADNVVIGACVLTHFEATPQERDAYLSGGEIRWKEAGGEEQVVALSPERMAEMKAAEQLLLTVTSRGYGKRFSSMGFRTVGRGSMGVNVGDISVSSGPLVALMPVLEADGVVLVTDGAQAIRTRIAEVRIAGRTTRGVKMFDLADGQQIVDVARVASETEAA